jgi:hypothetical protein
MKDLDALGQTSGFPAPETLIMSLPLELTSLFTLLANTGTIQSLRGCNDNNAPTSVGLPAQNPQVTEAQSGIL